MLRPGSCGFGVVPYIGTWIETDRDERGHETVDVVPYIGTWIETNIMCKSEIFAKVVPYIGTWIETKENSISVEQKRSRTLYRYVD